MSFTVNYFWRPENQWKSARLGLSLHSHTSVSRECVGILFEHGARNPLVAWALAREQRRYQRKYGKALDFKRAYWTSPVTPHEAYSLECEQIRKSLGIRPLVSVTDHDAIEANKRLQLLGEDVDIPISTEWTVPFGKTFFHFGIHNLPKEQADALYTQMQDFRKNAAPGSLVELLKTLSAIPEVLVILNHPLWDEGGIGQQEHEVALQSLLSLCKGLIHGLELNGLRTWNENRRTMRLAEETGLPAVSGGDRHGFEPNALLNLSQASSFAEFVDEVRSGHSQVLVMPQYRENRNLRCFQTAWDMIREHPEHPYGQVTCLHRTYFIGDDGQHAPLTSIFPNGTPPLLAKVLWAVRVLESPRLRPALRMALSDGEGFPS